MNEKRRALQESLASFEGDPGRWAPPFDPAGDGRWFPDHHAGVDRAEERDPTDITFFRTGWEGADFSNLTIPRRFMNRSTFERVSFVNTDLNQSFMCWNDFIECDFTDADLTCCDMRASVFRDCKFVRARLIGADLQRSGFEGCDFTDANLFGARVDDTTMDEMDFELTQEQEDWLVFTDDPDGIGPQPKGG